VKGMKILAIRVSGYKKLKDNFEINFLNKAKVMDIHKDSGEVLELGNKLYFPTVTAITGKNSSGKSTVLSLIEMCHDLLFEGRIVYDKLMFNKNTIDLVIYFKMEEYIYKYEGSFKGANNLIGEINRTSFCIFIKEELSKVKYSSRLGKNIEKYNYKEVEISPSIDDTSILYNITARKFFAYSISNSKEDNLEQYFLLIEKLPDYLKKGFVNIFDDNIEKLVELRKNDLYLIKFYNEKELELNRHQLLSVLSDGTLKGINLLAITSSILKLGSTLIIDEIENSFHKNLVELILMLFKDKKLNKKNSNIIFSTHYVEILDILRRNDSIWLMDKKEGVIDSKNLYLDFDVRQDISKSSLFNHNYFENLIPLDRLNTLKKGLKNEVPNNV